MVAAITVAQSLDDKDMEALSLLLTVPSFDVSSVRQISALCRPSLCCRILLAFSKSATMWRLKSLWPRNVSLGCFFVPTCPRAWNIKVPGARLCVFTL